MSDQQTLPPASENETTHPSPEVEVGEWAADLEKENDDRLLVLEHTSKRADEEVIYETPPADDDITVATYNTDYGYPASEPISRIAYRDSLVDEYGTLDDETVSSVFRDYQDDSVPESVDIYSFPRSRLREVTNK